jgi:rare lipoprotein A
LALAGAGLLFRGVGSIVTGLRIEGRWRRFVRAGVLAAACAALAGCASSGSLVSKNSKYSPKVIADGEPVPKGGGSYKVGQPYQLNGKTYYPTEKSRYRTEGVASWYGPDFHGRLTANGEIYDMHAISAAHPTMPLPSYARVTNLDNGRSIVVRVNDRGPYARDRVMDLSIGAAKALDFYRRGLAHVRVEYVGRAPMEGSDDRRLMATLRYGRPAPAPSDVKLAALNPLLPVFGAAREAIAEGPWASPPVPAERPYNLGTGSITSRNATSRAPADKRGRSTTFAADSEPGEPDVTYAPTASTAFAPGRDDRGLALMSGRGLY